MQAVIELHNAMYPFMISDNDIIKNFPTWKEPDTMEDLKKYVDKIFETESIIVHGTEDLKTYLNCVIILHTKDGFLPVLNHKKGSIYTGEKWDNPDNLDIKGYMII